MPLETTSNSMESPFSPFTVIKSFRSLFSRFADGVPIITLLLFGLSPVAATADASSFVAFNTDWLFYGGEKDSARFPETRDYAWQKLTLPHHRDHQIEDVAWYRKHFSLPPSTSGQHVTIRFDAIAGDATIWLNGHEIGRHRQSPSIVEFDLTSRTMFGLKKNNVIAIKLSTSAPNSLAPLALARHVWLRHSAPIRIAASGMTITTPRVWAKSAALDIDIPLVNSLDSESHLSLAQSFSDSTGNIVSQRSENFVIPAHRTTRFQQRLNLPFPDPLNTGSSIFYHATTSLMRDGQLIDQVESLVQIVRPLADHAPDSLPPPSSEGAPPNITIFASSPGETPNTQTYSIYTNCDEVELFHHGQSLGRKSPDSDPTAIPVNFHQVDQPTPLARYHLQWVVPRAPGTVKAIGYQNGTKNLTIAPP